jgi:hypothetical protein
MLPGLAVDRPVNRRCNSEEGSRLAGQATLDSLVTRGEVHRQVTGTQIPSKGDQVEQRRMGVIRRGYVWYADQLQILVKWEDGKSSSLRLGSDLLYIVIHAGEAPGREEEAADALPEFVREASRL